MVAHGRLPKGPSPAGFIDLAPDLVGEVVSPNDAAAAVQAQVEDWLQAGPHLDWVIYPETRSVAVYGSLSELRPLHEGDALEGGDVAPGVSCSVADTL